MPVLPGLPEGVTMKLSQCVQLKLELDIRLEEADALT